MFIRLKFFVLTLLLIIATADFLYAASPLKIVATQTIFADLARQVGGDKVEVKPVASPKFNVHFIQPKPSDVRNVANADLFVHAGLDLEAWRDPLLEAAGRPEFFAGQEKSVDLSQGIRLLNVPTHRLSRAEGDIHLYGNPHFHMNPENLKVMASTLAEKLKETDPANALYYEANLSQFLSKLDQKILAWKAMCPQCAGQEILSYHDDIVYFAHYLGLKDGEFLEPKPGIPPTPKHLSSLETYAKEKGIKAILMPTYFPRAAAEALEKRVGVKAVTVCQNVGEISGTEDVFSFFDYNVRAISEALK